MVDVQVCAEHKKPLKLLKHLEAIKAASKGERSVPRVLVFCNRIKVRVFLPC
jgi:ATP-dependent RNA helicase DDX5/DBP2